MSSFGSRLVDSFREIKRKEPLIIQHTREKYGEERAKKQKVAIAFSKAKEGRRVFK